MILNHHRTVRMQPGGQGDQTKKAASYWQARSNLYPLMLTILERVITRIYKPHMPEMVRMVQRYPLL